MGVRVNPPPSMKIPRQWQNDPEIVAYYKNFDRMMLQLWLRTGGATDAVANANETTNNFNSITQDLYKRIGTGLNFTIDTTGFTFDSTEITFDKVIA